MRKFFILLFLALCLNVNVSAQSRKKVAVIEFIAGVGVDQSEVEGISAIFITYFSPRGYTLVERTQIDNVRKEQDFQGTNLTQNQMVKLGEILNVKYMVVGDVNIVHNQYNVDARVLDVETGQIAAKCGRTWDRQSSYRTQMSVLAEELSSKLEEMGNVSKRYTQVNTSSYSAPIVLYDYLVVYPKLLGYFQQIPSSLIKQINSQNSYECSTWRLPTAEEVEIIRNNSSAISFVESTKPLWVAGDNRGGQLLLVTTIKEKEDNAEGKINGHEYVDLGLPSGLKWATCNVGASRPEDYGGYFAWGETSSKGSYSESNSVTYNVSVSQLRSSGVIGSDGSLTPAYDAARANWGGSWRMPTAAEI
ncbi:MAG: hypothetical protein HUK03_09675, partial [Bacteroidaceae bacterium]|nr:hypothetical protein [Bacteroidaceae bacterium]